MTKLNKQIRQAIAYALDASSFIFGEETAQDIQGIYLYGSAVRGQLRKESDLDLFIDCPHDIEKQVKAAINRFYLSKDYDKWRHLGFIPEISVHVGKLSEWELQSSIQAEGLQLFSKRVESHGDRYDLFILELPKDKKKYLRFIRAFFGRKEHNYVDKGMLDKLQGQKLSSNVVLIRKDWEAELITFLQKEKINYSFKEMVMY